MCVNPAAAFRKIWAQKRVFCFSNARFIGIGRGAENGMRSVWAASVLRCLLLRLCGGCFGGVCFCRGLDVVRGGGGSVGYCWVTA
jgi:hypothetical protein